MTTLRKVTLIYDAKSSYDLKVIEGVATYVRQVGNWRLHIEHDALRNRRLAGSFICRNDGVIANLDDPKVAAALAEAKIPVVAFGSGIDLLAPTASIPCFTTNNEAVGRLAAEHLLERGFRRFAYFGHRSAHLKDRSQERFAAFQDRLNQAGYSCIAYAGDRKSMADWDKMQQALSDWLTPLEKPLGLMACDDHLAHQILEAARCIGIPVPEEMAVLGVDNDELLCQLATPPLSSVKHGCMELGYQAAALLDEMMAGRHPPSTKFVIEPEGVVSRRSTEILAVNDGEVTAALLFIRENACKGITVSHVVKAVGASRSGLEAKFMGVMGRSIHAEITRLRTQRVKQLLVDTEMPLKQIAATAGFRSVQYMATVFRRVTGRTPHELRKRPILGHSGLPGKQEKSYKFKQKL